MATSSADVEQMIAPTLTAGDNLIVDNLARPQGCRQAIEARSASLFYLPAYSPDLNLIEQLFAKLKALLRKTAARSLDASEQASANSFALSRRKNAPTISATPATHQRERNLL